MAAPKSEEEKYVLFYEIIECISEDGMSLTKAAKGKLSKATFYKIIDSDPKKMNQYVRACEARADRMFDDMLDIADDGANDYTKKSIGGGVEVDVPNNENIQRSRLRVDTRKWQLSKLNPKKYGEKSVVDITSKGDKLEPPKIIFNG